MKETPDGDDSDFEILEIIDLSEHEATRIPPATPVKPVPSAAQRTGGVPIMRPGERDEIRRAAVREVLRQVLPPLDALETCLRERPDQATLVQGVRLALRELWDVFRPFEIDRIEGHGMPFDPRRHEAAEVTPSQRVPVNTVLETLRVGYTLGGELVRPALVRVSVEQPEPEQEGDAR